MRGAQRDPLDRALRPAAEVDGVADPHLILGHDEEAGDEVAHHGLGAEAQGHARDAGSGDERAEVESEHVEDAGETDEPEERGGQ